VLCDLRERPIFIVSGAQAEHDDSLENSRSVLTPFAVLPEASQSSMYILALIPVK